MLTLGLVTTVSAESQNTDVEVEVDSTVQLDVKPDRLEYTSAGEEGILNPGETREVSDEGFGQIDISNVGSDRLDNIYAESDLPGAQPFGTEVATGEDENFHNTGNFVTFSLETVQESEDFRSGLTTGLNTVEDSHYLNRVEFFEDTPPEFIQTIGTGDETFSEDLIHSGSGDATIDPEETHVGRFRVGELDYFFVVYDEDADGNLENADAWMAIAEVPTTPDELGTFDFTSDGEDFTLFEMGTDSNDFNQLETSQDFVNPTGVDASGEQLRDGDSSNIPTEWDDDEYEVRTYEVYVDALDEAAVRTRYNVEAPSPDGRTADDDTDGVQQYILDADSESDNQEEALQPGENFPVDFGVQVPNGVDAESIDEGTVTLNAEAYTDDS